MLRRVPYRALAGAAVAVVVVLLLGQLPEAQCQDKVTDFGNPAAGELFAQVVYSKLSNLTNSFAVEISKNLSFCISDPSKEWNAAFNFSSDLDFLAKCIIQTNGDLTQRICTAAEMNLYFNSLKENGGGGIHLQPNKNCNLTSSVSGCEPGWACSVGQNLKIDLQNRMVMPDRILDCQPCCEGFFCPHGLTCMIPCPLGSYCPLAKLNEASGVCEPYSYQLPSGSQNHTCGGADMWADVGSSGEIFCPAGSYCPSNILKYNCSSGHYCRMGSTSEKRCFHKSSCAPNSANQDITVFGALMMVALSLLLLIIYNFSGQLLTLLKRKEAKSREAAARSARATAHARERWKVAKNAAKKHALGLQAQLSRTFSRKRSMKQSGPLTASGQLLIESDDASGLQYSSSFAAVPPSAASASTSKEPSNLIQMMETLDEYPDSDEGFDFEIVHENVEKSMPKGVEKSMPKVKEMHTRSQIFKYAYAQIEKEKALEELNKNLTFSGIISLATKREIKTRPVIEVAFKDLSLNLRGSKKQLLRCVTGKLKPGHVTAVMGPSGAGKTTFLNALAGKATGCHLGGLVLINGKAESIRTYKRIIGFVPQDDIVHGNLTVEENLWFSAKCRLAADMPKADKVLVVERVIESLGLQAVRDSLVGTVEKRGISGGQRKRVNVGLEMVMEPSLLLLDEPTSGLDSSSSLLLLKALRHEALEGVNICMVVHQPSYASFKMFDDLMLLAKGGLTAYHGPVEKVEDYFSGLGIYVPDRVNPPDYYIDILEGIVKPTTSTGVHYTQLPIRWMLHNGFEVPSDMQYLLPELNSSDNVGERDLARVGSEELSISGAIWQNVKGTIGHRRDDFEYNFSKIKDLSNRRTPGILKQYKYFLGRVGKQRLRDARIQAVDYLILCLAGVCIGTVVKVSDETFGAAGYTYSIIAVSLLCKIGALRSFSLEKLQYLRERASGMSSLAYFLSKDTIDHFNTVIKPIVYLSMYYFFNNPRSSFGSNYMILVALVYCVTGIGYTFAIFFESGSAQLWSALVPVVLTLIATQRGNSKLLANLCYPKWALEAFLIVNAKRYPGVWLITRCGLLLRSGYNVHELVLCVGILFLYGVVFRCIAFFCLLTFQWK